MTARERYVTFECDVCVALGCEDTEYTEPFDADEDSWSPDRCPEHLEWVWDDKANTYVDPEADEEEGEDYSEEETVVGTIAAQCARAARLEREAKDRADFEEGQRD